MSGQTIEMRPIGFVRRASLEENERDRSLVAQIVFDKDLLPALDGIEEWSRLYVIFWLDRVVPAAKKVSIPASDWSSVLTLQQPYGT